jgi:hypothetical protein
MAVVDDSHQAVMSGGLAKDLQLRRFSNLHHADAMPSSAKSKDVLAGSAVHSCNG